MAEEAGKHGSGGSEHRHRAQAFVKAFNHALSKTIEAASWSTVTAQFSELIPAESAAYLGDLYTQFLSNVERCTSAGDVADATHTAAKAELESRLQGTLGALRERNAQLEAEIARLKQEQKHNQQSQPQAEQADTLTQAGPFSKKLAQVARVADAEASPARQEELEVFLGQLK
ncbi:hypothetical protein PTSG_02060 [Salpingoeca rosetta]|uniref:Uncharacterized protein n=1 Tax=Salpingoeca rosetta (strain ATCC 50818 / BSB-021) TaxID=946362 RepID=F2TZR9_SALR5|nr:uncharacterized protein PTSG_02060 [Salpingoeca rosetta]EGD79093.1 hypothetical protein PTSG_02060 [Salpingoeca rosetta]|eukprot:XP_004998049.1 hypothetical protein PTSG_02060 [Salpingoeca rosetta]